MLKEYPALSNLASKETRTCRRNTSVELQYLRTELYGQFISGGSRWSSDHRQIHFVIAISGKRRKCVTPYLRRTASQFLRISHSLTLVRIMQVGIPVEHHDHYSAMFLYGYIKSAKNAVLDDSVFTLCARHRAAEGDSGRKINVSLAANILLTFIYMMRCNLEF